MRNTITEALAAKIQDRFHKVYPLAELVTTDKKSYPAVWNGKDYTPIQLDGKVSSAYFRQSGSVSVSDYESKIPVKMNEYRYPITLIACVKREEIDDLEMLVHMIYGDVVMAANPLRGNLKATTVKVHLTGYNTDFKTVLQGEYQPLVVPPLEFAVVSLSLRVDVVVSPLCIETFCKNYCNG